MLHKIIKKSLSSESLTEIKTLFFSWSRRHARRVFETRNARKTKKTAKKPLGELVARSRVRASSKSLYGQWQPFNWTWLPWLLLLLLQLLQLAHFLSLTKRFYLTHSSGLAERPKWVGSYASFYCCCCRCCRFNFKRRTAARLSAGKSNLDTQYHLLRAVHVQGTRPQRSLRPLVGSIFQPNSRLTSHFMRF